MRKLFAALAALLWIGGLTALASGQAGGDLSGVLAGLTPVQGVIAAAALALPPLLFAVAAMLAVRAQEMRLVARAVGEVAVRLAEPDLPAGAALVRRAKLLPAYRWNSFGLRYGRRRAAPSVPPAESPPTAMRSSRRLSPVG